eukprot:g9293.t1
MPSFEEAAAGKENVGSTSAKPVRRGVGPRSGTKQSAPPVPKPRPPTSSSTALGSDTAAVPRSAVASPAWRTSSRAEAHAPNPGGVINAPSSGEVATASARLDAGAITAAPGAATHKTQQQKKKRCSEPAMLSSASPLLPSGISGRKGASGGGGGGREIKRGSATRSGGGATGQAKRKRRELVVKSNAAKRKPRANEEGDKAKSRKPAGLTSDPALRLPSQGRSDFDFDLTDDEFDDNGTSSRSSESANKGPAARLAENSCRRKSIAPGAARAGRKRVRGGDAGEKNARAKQPRTPSIRRGVSRNHQELVPQEEPAEPLSYSPKPTAPSSTRQRPASAAPAPAAHPADPSSSSPHSTSSARGGGGDGDEDLSPRGSWHLGAFFGESDDDDNVQGDENEAGACNWRLSDDEGESGMDAPRSEQRRSSAGIRASSAAAASGKKKRRASGGGAGGRGGSVDDRSGSKKRRSTGRSGGGGGGSHGDDGGDDEVVKGGWADRLPPPASVDAGSDSGAGSQGQSAADQAVLEALRAQFKKVDSHKLNISR